MSKEITIRQDDEGRMQIVANVPERFGLVVEINVQYFPLSDWYRAATKSLTRGSGEPFVSEPYKNPLYAVANLFMKLANMSDGDASLALERAVMSGIDVPTATPKDT